MPAGHDLEREQVTQRLLVELDLACADDLRERADDDQRWDSQCVEGRRRGRQLHIRLADGVSGVPVTDPSVGPLDTVDGDLLLEDVARRVRKAAPNDARLERLLHRGVGLLLAGLGSEVVGPEGRDEDGRVEENGAPDEVGAHCGDLHRQPAAEAVADPVRGLVEGVEQVGYVGGDVPRLVPRRVPVPAKVGGDDVEPIGQPLLGQLPEAQAMAGDAMEADDERCAFVPHSYVFSLTSLPRARSTFVP